VIVTTPETIKRWMGGFGIALFVSAVSILILSSFVNISCVFKLQWSTSVEIGKGYDEDMRYFVCTDFRRDHYCDFPALVSSYLSDVFFGFIWFFYIAILGFFDSNWIFSVANLIYLCLLTYILVKCPGKVLPAKKVALVLAMIGVSVIVYGIVYATDFFGLW